MNAFSDSMHTAGFDLFRQAVVALNGRIGVALSQGLQVDSSPDASQRAGAFSLLLGDLYYLVQWVWSDSDRLDRQQAGWLGAMDAWIDELSGEEPGELSVQSRQRLWQELIRSDSFCQQLDEILSPCPRSLTLLRDFDSVQGTLHAADLQAFLHQTGLWAAGQNPPDWQAPRQRVNRLLPLLGAEPGLVQQDGGRPAAFEDAQSNNLQSPDGSAHINLSSTNTSAQNAGAQHVALNDLLRELDSLVGLSAVKAEVRSLVNLLQVNGLRKHRGLPSLDVTRHMVFHGGPGTGKTTVARLLARIFQVLGVLKKGHLVETDRSGLVAAYVGQTALKVKRVVNQADEGVLFIDEAYALARGENDFGGEAIETLLKLMEDRRDSLVVIVAGYTERMQTFIQSNPGLKSRFTRYFNFDDYSVAQLTHILLRMVEQHGMSLTEQARLRVEQCLQDDAHRRAMESGNARFVRNCFEKATMAQANRLAAQSHISDQDLCTLTAQDIDWALSESLRELH